ncbi:secondary thiamine-phosphate synthase enzyme YjbQ [Cecembia rubra]|uniref:Secondary thiamine-phosphate synthase enzyme n=1 Tax=Cecembia rubra TaxID=1485585 RepID=A0A2P8DTH0_9BACT|nr:secondary thiamine-phosphate synthase enzyme YjbQ [Cecembia rubra]PSL00508.1 secondary thiamine-phosphate synthase enzyme [Cecembia rubra]
MKTFQKTIRLKPYPRGFHLITDWIEKEFPELKEIQIGILHVFIQHTSAGLTINENADPSVRKDFETFINDLIPENYSRFIHNYEGPDDMPAHIKSSLFGNSVQIPISNGKMNLGTWQGLYLCEFRDNGGSRKLVLTAIGN